MKQFLMVFLLSVSLTGLCAQPQRPLTVTLLNNATLLPGGGELGVWGVPVHPGFTVGTEWLYNDHPGHDWFQTAVLGYHYHRYVQHAVKVYSETGYRRRLGQHFDVEARLGLGYLHNIPAHQIFEQNSDGDYERTGAGGRPQFMGSVSLGPGYRLPNDWRIILQYQFYLQMPYVREYVPLMPNTALHLGVSFPFFQTKN